MIPSIVRGKMSPALELQICNYLSQFKTRHIKQLKYQKDIRRLAKINHDIVLDFSGPTMWLIFIKFEDNKPLTVLWVFPTRTNGNKKECIKIDLGPGIKKELFSGTVLEVKWQNNTFHLIDVLLYKGQEVENRDIVINSLNTDVIPFMDRPKVFSYQDIPSLTQHRLLFLPPQASMPSWSFIPEMVLTTARNQKNQNA
jgi:hypothetical protein